MVRYCGIAGVAPDGNAYLTNVVLADWVQLVIVGASWVEGNTYLQIVALHAQNGSVAWTSLQNDLYHSTSICVSQTSNAVYLGGFDKRTFAALSLKDGSLLWENRDIYLLGLFMQTKIGSRSSGVDEEVVLLPTDPFDGSGGKGRLFSYELDSSGKTYWSVDVGFDEGALFAFSTFGVIFGFDGTGGGAGGMKTFGINASRGDVIFSNFGFCNPVAQNSGPAVDIYGYAYYSCGNQAYSVYPNGSLRWISEVYGEPNPYFSISPSLHPGGLLYFIHSNESVLIALSTQDGLLHKWYEITSLPYFEPPIIVGDSMIYLFGFAESSIVISGGHVGGATEDPGEALLKGVQNLIPVQTKRETNPGVFGALTKAVSASLFFHPYQFGQTLIQLGYEPVLPSRRYSFVFREYMLYHPGIIGYSRAIIRSDGWRALYRGLGASIVYNFINIGAESIIEPWVSAAVDKLPLSVVESGTDVPDTEENVSTVRAVAVRGLKYFVVSTCTRTLVRLAAHPFEVILVRAIAQHVTKQDMFSSVWGSMKTIYQNEGFAGFYAGFVPACISIVVHSAVQTMIWIACESAALYITTKLGQVMLKLCLEVPLFIYLPRTYSYPYQLVSRTMMVSSCGLNIDLPAFQSYRDCYNHLSASKLLYRGSAILFPRFVARDHP
eukprot:Em0047g3a